MRLKTSSMIHCLICFFEDFCKTAKVFLWSWLICDCVLDLFSTLIAGVCAWCVFWFVFFFRASAQRRTPVRNQMHVCHSFSGDCGQHFSGCSSAVSPFPSAVPDRFVDVESVQDAVWSTAPTPTLLLLRPARDRKQFWFQKIDAH